MLIKIASYLVVAAIFMGIGYFAANSNQPIKITSEEIKEQFVRTLDKYTIEYISKAKVKESKIEIKKTLTEEDKYTSHLFEFYFDPTLETGILKKVTGVIHLPKTENPNQKFPLIFMNRGYVDQTLYSPGMGTNPSARKFAEAGFMTIALDYLGYGESNSNVEDILESRFQTYTTVYSLWNNIQSLPQWDKTNVFLWGHSNGGLISMTLLEMVENDPPTVLWAPVSKPFPYSVLVFTDESADRGKFLRSEISAFEKNYNPDLYSFDLYLDRISAPIQLHQGSADDAVPIWWSNSLAQQLKTKEIEVEYFTYPGSDHNLRPAWDTVVERTIKYFQKHSK